MCSLLLQSIACLSLCLGASAVQVQPLQGNEETAPATQGNLEGSVSGMALNPEEALLLETMLDPDAEFDAIQAMAAAFEDDEEDWLTISQASDDVLVATLDRGDGVRVLVFALDEQSGEYTLSADLLVGEETTEVLALNQEAFTLHQMHRASVSMDLALNEDEVPVGGAGTARDVNCAIGPNLACCGYESQGRYRMICFCRGSGQSNWVKCIDFDSMP